MDPLFLRVVRKYMYTKVALVSGQPRDAKKVSSVTGAGRLRELFSSWPLGGRGGRG